MAKILVENTTDHDIVLRISSGKEVQPVTIPARTKDAVDEKKIINGRESVDSEFLEKAKKYPVVQHYFDQGFLRELKSSKSESKAA